MIRLAVAFAAAICTAFVGGFALGAYSEAHWFEEED